MPPNVSTSATTDLMRTSQADPRSVKVVYQPAADSRVSYTIEPHPPTPRDEQKRS